MSDRYDPPGGESTWPPGASERAGDAGGEWGGRPLSARANAANQGNGAIIPFEPFARRRAGGFEAYEQPLSSTDLLTTTTLPLLPMGGQAVLRGGSGLVMGEEGGAQDRGEKHLIFSLDSYECGIRADQIQTVERLPDITPVPHVVVWVDGLVHLRGQILSVVDLRSFLGLERQPPSPRTRLVAARVGDLVIGLVVDGINEMRGILPNMIQWQHITPSLPGWAAPYASGIALMGNRSILIFDMERLLLSEKMHRYQAEN